MVMVTIIVPVYNCEKYIKECIQSIIIQSYTNIEIILVDDGSTDNSGLICDKFAKVDNRIRVIHNVNRGVSFARNSAISIAKGDYICFVDSDDWLQRDAVEWMVDEMKSSESEIIVSSFCDTDGVTERNMVLPDSRVLGAQLMHMFSNEYYAFSGPWAKLFQTNIIKNNNLLFKLDMPYGEDSLFVTEYLMHCKSVCTISHKTYCHRMHFQSVSSEYRYHRDMNLYMQNNFISINNLLSIICDDDTEKSVVLTEFANRFFYHIVRHYLLHANIRCFAKRTYNFTRFVKEYKICLLDTNEYVDDKSMYYLRNEWFYRFAIICKKNNLFAIVKFQIKKFLKK